MLHSELGQTGFQPPHERRAFVHKKIGAIASKAAPFVGMIPGVGTVAAAGLGFGGGLLAGEGFKGALKSGAKGAIGSLAGEAIGRIPGIGKVGGALFDFAKSNPELIAGGIAAIQGAKTQGQRDEIREEMLANARADRERRQGFLGQVDLQGLRDIQAPDLSTIFADPNNPFARSGRTPGADVTPVPIQGATSLRALSPGVAGGLAGPVKAARKKRKVSGLPMQGGTGSAVRGV